MKKPLKILILEDSLDDAVLLERLLRKDGLEFTSIIVDNRTGFENGLSEFQPDVVISDHTLPQFDSLEALKLFGRYKESQHSTASFILVTGTVSEEFAVEIMKKGADDYILKDRLKRLPTAITSAMAKNELVEHRRKVEQEKLHLLGMLEKSLHEIYVFDPETFLIEYANEEALRNLGYSFEEIQKLSPRDLIEQFDEENFLKVLSGAENSRKGKIYERNALRKDKTTYPIQIHLQVVEHGSRQKYLANVLDKTELKKQEQQKELAMFIQNIFNETPRLDRSLELVLEKICRIAKAASAEIFVRRFEENNLKRFAHWNNGNSEPSSRSGSLLSGMAAEKGSTIYCRNLQKELLGNQEEMPREENRAAVAHPIFLGREVLAVLVIYYKEEGRDTDSFFDLSENVRDQLANNIKRKRAEIELAKIFEISPDVMLVVGLDGVIKKANPSFHKNLGYGPDELESLRIRDFVHPEDEQTLDDWQDAVLEKREVSYHINRYRTKGGIYKWFSWSSTPFMDEGLAFAVGKDVTEQKKHIQAIEAQNRKLAEIAWEQSHLVRAPLTRMMGCIDYIEENETLNRELLKSVKDSAYEIDDIIKAIVNKAEQIKEV